MGTVSSVGNEADRLAGSVMEEIDADASAVLEAERRLQANKRAAEPRRKVGLAVLFAAFLALTVLNLTGIGPFGFTRPALSGEDLRLAMSSELDDMTGELEMYHEEFGAYPDNLAVIGMDDPAWEYQRLSPDRCRLALREEREVVTAELTGAER